MPAPEHGQPCPVAEMGLQASLGAIVAKRLRSHR